MILLSTGSLHLFGTRRVFELAAEAGFDGLEILIDGRADTWQPKYLSRLADEYGLTIASLHSPFLLNVAYWPHQEGERIERTVRLAETLGANIVVTHLPTRWPYSIVIAGRRRFPLPHFWQRNSKTVRWFEQELPFLQADTDVQIAVEMMPMHRLFKWPVNAHVWNTLDEWSGRFDHLTLDTTHCGTWRVDPRKAFDRAAGRVRHIHLSNLDGHQHTLPQRGELPLDQFLRHVSAAGYNGHVVVETSPEAMESDDSAQVRKNLAASLAFCREHLRA